MDCLRHKIYNTFKYFLLLLFVGYYGGIALFYHAHTLNGVVVIHSHPYKQSSSNKFPFEPHKHGKGEYALIHLLNKIVVEEPENLSFLPDPIFSYTQLPYVSFTDDFLSSNGLGFQLRGPPHFI